MLIIPNHRFILEKPDPIPRKAKTERMFMSKDKYDVGNLSNICGYSIRQMICNGIIEAKCFSVLADEACGVSNVEQMPVVLRFVDTTANIREEFIGLSQCNEGMTGTAIASTLFKSIDDFSLNMKLCRGQGEDGAANMSGKCSGAAALLHHYCIQISKSTIRPL